MKKRVVTGCCHRERPWFVRQTGHLARYVVDVVEALDLSALVRQYAGRGSDAHHPGTLLALPPELGTVQALVADNGFMSEANVRACAAPAAGDAAPIVPLIALAREPHHTDLLRRFAHEPFGPAPQDPLAAMAHRLKTREGRALYALRKSTVEPVIGIIKSVMRFRQFLLRGVEQVSDEWDLVCLAYNVKRMHRMQGT